MVQKLWLRNTEKFMLFDEYDLDFDPMTLVLTLINLDVMETHWYHLFQKSLSGHTGTQTDL